MIKKFHLNFFNKLYIKLLLKNEKKMVTNMLVYGFACCLNLI